MLRSKRLLVLFCLILLPAVARAQTVPQARVLIPQEPANLGQLKLQLERYHDCQLSHGCYTPDLNRQDGWAIEFLKGRVARAKDGEKMALVLDIDETALSNWEEVKKYDFGFVPSEWNEWVLSEKGAAIEGTLRLYNEAVKDGVAVFFITGRGTEQERATAENLEAVGYHDWAGLALRGPHPSGQTVTEYKSGERQKIVDAGYKIILNVGDQMSDLNGTPQAEASVKLPDPFYYLP